MDDEVLVENDIEITELQADDPTDYENIRYNIWLVTDNQADAYNSNNSAIIQKLDEIETTLSDYIASVSVVDSDNDVSVVTPEQQIIQELQTQNNYLNMFLALFIISFAWSHLKSWGVKSK